MKAVTRLRFKDFFKTLVVSAFAVSIPLMLLFYAVQAKRYTDLAREITELERAQEKLIEENKRLVSEISVLSSAERIEKKATEELGMHKAQSDDIVRVEMAESR